MFGMFRIYTVGFPVRHQIAETSLPQQLLQMDPLQRPPCPVAASRAVSAVSYAWLVTCRPNPGWHADIIWVESRLCSAFRRYDCAVPLQSFCSTSQDSANAQKLYPTGGDSSNQWNRKIQDVASWIPASLHIPPLWTCLCQHSNKWKWGLSWKTTLTRRDGTCPSINNAPALGGVSQPYGVTETQNKLIQILQKIFQTANYVYICCW